MADLRAGGPKVQHEGQWDRSGDTGRAGVGSAGLGKPAWIPFPSIFRIKPLDLCLYLYLRKKSFVTLLKEKP